MKMRQQLILGEDGKLIIDMHLRQSSLMLACLEAGDIVTILQPYERYPWHRGEGAEDANI